MSTIIFDEEFVRELEEDPVKLLTALGIKPTKEVLAQIAELDTSALRRILRAYQIESRSHKEVKLIFP